MAREMLSRFIHLQDAARSWGGFEGVFKESRPDRNWFLLVQDLFSSFFLVFCLFFLHFFSFSLYSVFSLIFFQFSFRNWFALQQTWWRTHVQPIGKSWKRRCIPNNERTWGNLARKQSRHFLACFSRDDSAKQRPHNLCATQLLWSELSDSSPLTLVRFAWHLHSAP